MHDAKRPVWVIKTSGIPFDEIKDWDSEIASLTTELTEKEKESRFVKYYCRQIAMPTQENIKAAEQGNPLPRELAIRPEEYVDRMDSSFIDQVRSGYYVFEDGIGYSMARIPMPGVTDEQFAFFNENFTPEENLFYKCWYPGMHMKHYIRGCVEDVGTGMEVIYFLDSYTIEQLSGTEQYKVKDPYFIEFHGGSGVSWPMHNLFSNPRYALQANLWRDFPDGSGREMFIAFWYGLKWENKNVVRALPKGEKTDIQIVRAQLNHSIWEYTQVAELVSRFWKDNH